MQPAAHNWALDATFRKRLSHALANCRCRLLAQRGPHGGWTGHLSSSALSTAVAILALGEASPASCQELVARGLSWLSAHQNKDGGWGDTPSSPSNLSTTLLCWAAFSQTRRAPDRSAQLATDWLRARVGKLEPVAIADAVTRFYGNDRTFSVPILTVCALAGCFGKDPSVWRLVPQLPFEAALLPHQLFKWLRLPVVSYAIPALIAIGLVCHQRRARRWSPLYHLRERIKLPALNLLHSMQPESGGFLEATPLTGFVTLSLAAAGYASHRVAKAGVQFLEQSARSDGSWPIDTNLATWVTTLSVNSLDNAIAELTETERVQIRSWLIAQQHLKEHPFTHAAPGGWAWTDLSGGVPDADDTAGVLLALHRLGVPDKGTLQAVQHGIRWLLALQNRDGGFPTFCRGWGRLPFDRSCADITAHVLRAFRAWADADIPMRSEIPKALQRGVRYLAKSQSADGSWTPLWFGNQQTEKHCNKTYGTAQVLLTLHELTAEFPEIGPSRKAGLSWLIRAQNKDHGWGGDISVSSTIEETALALSALAGSKEHPEVLAQGLCWLLDHTKEGIEFPAAPIGLYFASLWYDERLYPLVFSLGALTRALHHCPTEPACLNEPATGVIN